MDCSGENAFWSEQTGAVLQPYGISIAGDASDVLIVGCNLTDNSENGLYLLGLGVEIPGNVYIRDCNASGYSGWSTALNLPSGARSVQVTNCAGYNDQSPAFITSPSSGPPTGPFYNYTYGYFGPVSFYVGALAGSAWTVLIGGHSTLLSTGAFYLPPGVSGQVNPGGGGPKPTFQVIGQ